MSDETQTPEPTPAHAPEPTPVETLTQTLLHQEYTPWRWHDLDACLWRFWRAIGYGPVPDTMDALIHQETGQVVARAQTHGDAGYTIGFLRPAEEGALPAYHLHGAFKLLPQLNGTTLVHVYRYGSTGDTAVDADLDDGLTGVWGVARKWMVDHAGGQPTPQRGKPVVALPRRAQTS